jgi:benzoyl-CoA reductase/2-hydroxyglutaryl-CoA dehydratase subunit BcrC/BadD/HgdB
MTRSKTPNEHARYERVRKTSSVHLSMEYAKIIQEIIDDFPYNPESMYYFYERTKDYISENNKELAKKKVIATSCIYVPEEIIYALGGYPLRICSGSQSYDQIGAEFLPAKACPLVKASIGQIHIDQYPMGAKPKLIIHPTSCDYKKKMPEVETASDIEYYTLELPSRKDTENARRYWVQSISDLTKKLEKVLNNKLSRKNLKGAIQLINNAQKEYRRLYEIRKRGPVIWGKDVILLTNSYFYEDIHSWTKQLHLLNNELEERIAKKQFIANANKPRILLTGSPSIFPNMKTPILIEQLGGYIAADEFCSSNRLLYDTVAVDEWFLYDMIPALADRYLKPCTCPNLTPNTDRDRKLINTIKEFNVDGVIYQAFAGCQLYEMESLRIGKMLEKEGIPMLYLETDYNPDDVGQLSTRIEAFLESLKALK